MWNLCKLLTSGGQLEESFETSTGQILLQVFPQMPAIYREVYFVFHIGNVFLIVTTYSIFKSLAEHHRI